jgi:hypothetical protein
LKEKPQRREFEMNERGTAKRAKTKYSIQRVGRTFFGDTITELSKVINGRRKPDEQR